MIECILCGGNLGSLGFLGTREYFSCRNCGMEFSQKESNDEVNAHGDLLAEPFEGVSGAGFQAHEGTGFDVELWSRSDES